jgi:hypothetical protein
LEKEEAKKEKSFEKRLVELHKEFLETIKDVYPLAVLGSLCIAIAAFTAQNYPDAQIYAITAASLFLTAFAISLLFKIVAHYYLALISYISTAFATMFLFLVVAAFAGAFPIVGKSLSTIQDVAIAVILLSGCIAFYGIRNKTESPIIRSCFTILVPLTLLIVSYYVVSILSRFIGYSLPDFLMYVYYSVLLIIAGLLLISILASEYKRKDRISVQKPREAFSSPSFSCDFPSKLIS